MSAVQDLLERKKIEYRPMGSDFVVLCTNPGHDDTSPSMRINNITGIYQCFSCGHKGNILTDYNEKVGGIQMKRDQLTALLQKTKAESVGLKMPDKAIRWTQPYRTMSAETMQKFEAFTYAEDFPNRIVFPIRDFSGKIKVFHGRHLESAGQPKYLNFPKQTTLPLFPHRPEIYHGRVVIVEGIMDALNLYDKGITNVITTFGLKNFTKDTAGILKMLGVTGIDIFFDDDSSHRSGKNPGQDAAVELREFVDGFGFSTVNIAFPNKDPGDLTYNQVQKLKDQLYG